jgi:serine protease Do
VSLEDKIKDLNERAAEMVERHQARQRQDAQRLAEHFQEEVDAWRSQTSGGQRGSSLDQSPVLARPGRREAAEACVQIFPYDTGRERPAGWSGSGAIVDTRGLVLTNYHVVNKERPWDILLVLATEQVDAPPEPLYLGKTLIEAPEVDLAVILLFAENGGDELDPAMTHLPAVELGDANTLEIGDELNIFGYPGIGQGTITYTQGRVSGFLSQEGVDFKRAWIKTDATISGGNSGGAALDEAGRLVGVPTIGGRFDMRPDEKGQLQPIGGSINRLRAVNLAYPLLEEAQRWLEENAKG